MRSENVYKPLTKDETRFIQISLPLIALLIVSLPLGALIFSVVWSIIYNFNDATSTHCHVNNYLPSISAAIGSYSPQKYVWRICIALHSTPRYIILYMYFIHYHRSLLILLFNFIEISSLLGLTFISSTENFRKYTHSFSTFFTSTFTTNSFFHFKGIHAISFIMFVFTEWIGMVFTSQLYHGKPKSRKRKSFLRLVNTISILLAFFFYARHNWYCEAGVYTMFALCEYIVVITNIAFHFQAYYDFHDYKLTVMSDDYPDYTL